MRRKWTTLLRIFRYGLDNFSRNTWLTTAATAVMTVTLLIVVTTFAARMLFTDTLTEIRQKIDISVYLSDEAEIKEVERFGNELKQLDDVTSVEYVSKEQAREIFKEQNKAEYETLSALGALDKNPLPASLRIKPEDPNNLEQITAVVDEERNKILRHETSAPSYAGERKDAIDAIARASQFSETAGLIAAIIFVVISVLIIFNTIRMAIFNRKDEIEIMKLIGAEKSFIRGPFIVEASLYGVLAAAISLILIYVALLTRGGDLANYDINVTNTLNFFKDWPILIVIGQMLVGIAIGIFSSLLAMRRYLKV